MTDMTETLIISGRTLDEWTILARRDDCFDHLLPSNLRGLVASHEAALAREAALRGALTPFAAFAALTDASRLPDDHAITQGSRLAAPQITVGHLRKARAALEVK